MSAKATCGAVDRAARREAARAGNQRLRKRDATRSVSAKGTCGAVARAARREAARAGKSEAPQTGRDEICVGEAICGGVARAARREAARAGKNGSTSVETTGHLSVRARRQWSILGLGSMFASPTKLGRREPAEPARGGGFGSPPVAPEFERS